MKVAVDIDGVLSKTFEKYGEELAKRGHDISGGPIDEATYYETDMLYPKIPTQVALDMYEEIWEEMRSGYDAYPGAAFVLNMLDHELEAVTNRRVFEDAKHCSITREWLDEHRIPLTRVHHTSDKVETCMQHGFDVLIEDSSRNALPVAQAGIPVLLFDHIYNRHLDHPNITRFTHWIEVPELLRRMQ